jgi:hypothetical protein
MRLVGTPSSVLAFAFLASLCRADDLVALGDEFTSAATESRWLQINDVEGWGTNQLEAWDIHSTVPGHMRLLPYTSTWFANHRGVLVHKNIPGNFIATARLFVGNRTGITGFPQRNFSLAGLFVHRPTGRTAARPNPVPPGFPAWPPGGAYATDWLPGQENYIFLSFGSAGNPGTRQYEVKSTESSNSSLYYANRGVPASGEIELQMVVLGNTTVVLRRHPGGAWVVENRYTVGNPDPFRRMPSFDHDANPATPPLHQMGITVYTDFDSANTHFGPGYDAAGALYQNYSVTNPANGFSANPDLLVHVDYIRFRRPDPALTETALAALDVDYPNRMLTTNDAPLALLPGTGAGSYLGDNANQPLGPDPETWRQTAFGPQADDPQAAFGADFDHDGLQNGVEYALGRDPLTANAEGGVVAGTDTERATLFFRPEDSVSAHVTLEVEASESLGVGTRVLIARRTAGAGVWSVLAGGAAVVENPSTGWVTVSDAIAGGDRRFLRLRARVE